MSEVTDALFHSAGEVLDRVSPAKVGVAVSGGGDSMALLHVLAGCARARNISLAAITINHGLRPEAEAEAKFVAKTCASLGIRHDTKHWANWSGEGNLQAQARAARYALISGWAEETGVDLVALGHTQDDQAETFLMRLSRKSGVDGLSEMQIDFERKGLRFVRPFLRHSRASLRTYLMGQGQKWVEDPSNDDENFDRVQARKVMACLAPLDLTAAQISKSSQNLAQASSALDHYALKEARNHVETDECDLILPVDIASRVPPEIARRMLSSILQYIGHLSYPPRDSLVAQVMCGVDSGSKRTLAGCLMSGKDGKLRVSREYNSVKGISCASDQLWDGRWHIKGPASPELQVRALGDSGLKKCPDWRETQLPRSSLLASPSVWSGTTLISAPLAGLANGWTATVSPTFEQFLATRAR